MQLSTTFNLAHNAGACESSYKKMGQALGGFDKYGKDTPFTLAKVLEVCGVDDALWCLRCTMPGQEALNQKVRCLFLADCLEHIQHLMKDERSRAVIPLLRRRAIGQATYEEMEAAAEGAWAAAEGAWAAAETRAAARAWAAAAARAWAAAAEAAWAAAEAEELDWQRQRLAFHLAQEV